MTTPVLKSLAVVALFAACGAPEAVDEDVATSEEALSTSSLSFVTLRHDNRRCMAPLCGGYWAKNVNRAGAETYVSALDFSQSGLDDANRALVTGAPEILVRGKLGKKDRGFNTRPLVVAEAWRGLPGQPIATGDAFYAFDDMRKVIRCAAAPCNGLTAKKLGTSGKTRFTSYALEPAQATLVDGAWLETRLGEQGGIATGHFERGERFPGGYAKILEVSQVFVRLPNVDGPCAQQPIARCSQGYTTAWFRDGNRCLIAEGCVEQRMCTLAVPSCEEGYTLQSWQGAGGCTAYACDPSFTVPGVE